ncbi:large ribosomal subunit protein mL55 [Xenentodon cancila]
MLVNTLLKCTRHDLITRCSVFPSALFHSHTVQMNSNRTSVVRCGRQKYERLYPVVLVRPDGSTVNIRYKEPRRILLVSTTPQVPPWYHPGTRLVPPWYLAGSTLVPGWFHPEERRARQKKREVRMTRKQAEEHVVDDDFSMDDYSHLWKKK